VCDVEFARGVAREQVVGDFASLLETEHLVLTQLMVGEDRVRVEATQHAALLAGEVEAHGLALRLQLLRLSACGADDVAVERAGEAAFRGRDDEQVDLVLAGARQQRRDARTARQLARQAGDDRLQPLGIGTTGLRRFLRTAQLGGGDHLHRLGDLLGRLDRVDPDLEGLQRRHCCPSCVPATAGTQYWAPACAGAH